MTSEVSEGPQVHHGHHDHEEVSWAPILVAFGMLFVLPLAFMFFFVYKQHFAAAIALGIGTPLILAGVARWIHEGANDPAMITGVSPLGIGVFIIGEILMFLGFFSSYWDMRIAYSAAGNVWPPAGTPHISVILPLVMTVFLVGSSVTYHFAEGRFEKGDKNGFIMWLLVTLVLGGVFLGCTLYEYGHLMHEGFYPGTNIYSSAFYSLTGFHASHVILGLGSFIALLLAVMMGKVHHLFVKVAGIYWHFVDVVWFFVASQVYFW